MTFNDLAIQITRGDDSEVKLRVYDWKAEPGSLQLGVNFSKYRGYPLTVGELRKTLDELEKHPMNGIIGAKE